MEGGSALKGVRMISALCWLPRGAAKEVPQTTELTEEDLAALQEAAGEAEGVPTLLQLYLSTVPHSRNQYVFIQTF